MMRRRAHLLAMTVLGAGMLSGCGANLNLLEAIDGPYVSPAERAEMARQASGGEQAVAAPMQELSPAAQAAEDAFAGAAEAAAADAAANAAAMAAAVEAAEAAERELREARLAAEASPALAEADEVAPEEEPVRPVYDDPQFIGPVLPAAEMETLGSVPTTQAEAAPEDLAPAELTPSEVTLAELTLAEPAPQTTFGDLNEPASRAEPEGTALLPTDVEADELPIFAPAPETIDALPEVEEPALAVVGPDSAAAEQERVEAALAPPSVPEPEAPEPEERASLIGPDFLPPEDEAPSATAPLTTGAESQDYAVAEIYIGPAPSAAVMGPTLESESTTRAPLETRLPSAYDYVAPVDPATQAINTRDLPPEPLPARPAAEESELERRAAELGFGVVSAMPTPTAPPAPANAASAASAAYRAFYDFAIQKLDAPLSGGARESMLLLDPVTLDPALQQCGNLPPAVLIDLDPANGLMPLVAPNRPNAELAGYLDLLRQRGVTVYWISGHGPSAARQIRMRLTESGLDPAGGDPLIVTRFAGESKQERRYALGETQCLLAIMGDHRADFDELYDFVLDPVMASPLEEHVDHGWFLAPPPLN